MSVAATVNILASDDGHGVVSFNSSQHFFLKEPTSQSSLSESVATLHVVRNPEDGTFGTVTAQFAITDSSGNLADADLRPAGGFVVLEEGVRLKVRGGSALLHRVVALKGAMFCFPLVNRCCFRRWRSGRFWMGNLKGTRPSR